MAKAKKETTTAKKEPVNPVNWLKGNRLYYAIVFAFSFVIYFNTLFNGYSLDDELVTNGQRVTSQGWEVLKFHFDAFGNVQTSDSSWGYKFKQFLPTVLTVQYYEDVRGFKYEYRPMVLATFALEHALFGSTQIVGDKKIEKDSPAPGHFINLLLYCLLCVVLFRVLQLLLAGYNVLFPLLATLIFAAHPIHTEVVASLKNRDELMSLLFSLCSFYFAIRFTENKKWWVLLLVPFFFLLAILSKTTTITFTLIVPLALIMLLNVPFSALMLVATALALPFMFYSRVYLFLQQLELFVVFYAVVLGFYVLKNYVTVWPQIKNLAAKGKITISAFKPRATPTLQPGALANPITILLVGIMAFALVGSAFGIYLGNVAIAFVGIIVFVALYVFAPQVLELLFITPVTILVLFAYYKFYYKASLLETGLVVFLAGQMVRGNKAFKITALVNYALFAIAAFALGRSHFWFNLLVFAVFIDKRLPILSGIALVVSLYPFGKDLYQVIGQHKQWRLVILHWPLLYLAVLLLWQKREKLFVPLSAALLPVLLLVSLLSTGYLRDDHSLRDIYAKTYYKVTNIKALDPTPVQLTVRPLAYPEYPIDAKTSFSVRLGTAAIVLGKYLKLIFIPYPMAYYYGYGYIIPEEVGSFVPLLVLALYFALLCVALYFFNKQPVISFSILLYLIAISIFTSFILPIPGLMGDRFLFVPSIGFALLLACALQYIFKFDWKDEELEWAYFERPVKITVSVLLVVYSVLTISRNSDWKDDLTLFRHDIKWVENSAQAQNLLAVNLFKHATEETNPPVQKQLLEESVGHFQKAIEIYPDFLNATFDLGRVLEALNQFDDAYKLYARTMVINPLFVLPCMRMGMIADAKGDHEQAIVLYKKFLTGYPMVPEAYTNLSYAYFQLKQFDSAIAVNRTAMQRFPASPIPVINIAKTYMNMQQKDSALYYMEAAHVLAPNDAGINGVIQQLRNTK